eukprot:4691561-Pyramimonas_sp.AAC.1
MVTVSAPASTVSQGPAPPSAAPRASRRHRRAAIHASSRRSRSRLPEAAPRPGAEAATEEGRVWRQGLGAA